MTTPDSSREQLKQKIDGLTPMGVHFVARVVDSLADPLRAQTETTAPTWINAESDWVEYFSYRISVHHGITTDALGLSAFETAFRAACEAVGWDIDPPGSATRRFVDLTVGTPDGSERRLSLKSTAAKRLSKTTAHISKLTEAAWIQDIRSSRARRAKTLALFQEYRTAVDEIVMLRAFRSSPTAIPHRYQLLGIPSDIFASLAEAPLTAFEADGPTIDCSYSGNPAAARVSLDRSDAKITVKQIQLSACDTHANWELA